MKKILLYICLLLATLCGISFYSISKKTLDCSELKHSNHFGFYNPAHFDTLLRNEYVLFSNMKSAGNDSLNFKLVRHMRVKVFWGFVNQELSYHFKIDPTISPLQRPMVFFEMCKQVSESFEQQQNTFPHSSIKASSASSFRTGDVTGDYLAYLYAISVIDTHKINEHFKDINEDFDNLERLQQLQDNFQKHPFQDWKQTKAIFDDFDFDDILPYSMDRYTAAKSLCHLKNMESHWYLSPLNYRHEYPLLFNSSFRNTFLLAFGTPILAVIMVLLNKRRFK